MPEAKLSNAEFIHGRAYLSQGSTEDFLPEADLNSPGFDRKKFWTSGAKIKSSIKTFKALGFNIGGTTQTGFFFSSHFFDLHLIFGDLNTNIKNWDGKSSISLRIANWEYDDHVIGITLFSTVAPVSLEHRIDSHQLEWDDRIPWQSLYEYSGETGQHLIWRLPYHFNFPAKNDQNKLAKIPESNAEWPYIRDGNMVPVHILDSKVTNDHAYFQLTKPSKFVTEDKAYRFTAYPLSAADIQLVSERATQSEMEALSLSLIDNAKLEEFNQKIIPFLSDEDISAQLTFAVELPKEIKSSEYKTLSSAFINEPEGFGKMLMQNGVFNQSDVPPIPSIRALITNNSAFTKLKTKICELEGPPHGTAVAANVLALAPGVHLHAHCMNYQTRDLNGKLVVDGALNLVERLNRIAEGATKTQIVNVSYEIQERTSDLIEALGEKILLVVASGNYGTRKDEKIDGSTVTYGNTATMNTQLDHQSVIQVAGAFQDRFKKLTFSSNSVGFRSEKVKGNQMVSPDVCGIDGGPQNGADQPTPGFEQHKDTTQYGPSGYGLLWCPTMTEMRMDKTKILPPEMILKAIGGTSYAAPQVCALAAIILEIWTSAKPAQIKKIIVEAADPIEAGKSANGVNAKELDVGMLNIGNAIKLTEAYQAFDIQNPQINPKDVKVDWDATRTSVTLTKKP